MAENQNPIEAPKFNPFAIENGAIYTTEPTPAPVETPAPVVEEVKPAVETPAPVVEPGIDFDSYVKEKTGGKFEKWDDLYKKVETPFEFENETSKQVFEMLQAGNIEGIGTFAIQRQMLAGVETMSEEDAIKMQMRLNDPDAEPDEIEEDFNDKYGAKPDADAMSEAEYKTALRKYNKAIKADAATAKADLLKLKEEIKLPTIEKPQPTGFTPEELAQETEAWAKAISDNVSESLNETGSLNFSFEDKDKGVQFSHEFKVSDQDKTELKDFFKDFHESFENRYKTNGGTYDGKKLMNDFFFVLNKDKIVKSAVMNALNQGSHNTAASIANVNVTPEATPAIDFAADQNRKAIANSILG